MATPSPKSVLEARERAKAQVPLANQKPVNPQAVTVTETPNAVPDNFIARAIPLPETVTVQNYIGTKELAEFPYFYITRAIHAEGRNFQQPGVPRKIIRMNVQLETESGWAEFIWTPDATSDRSTIASMYLKDSSLVIGPVKLEKTLTGNGQEYYALQNTEYTPF